MFRIIIVEDDPDTRNELRLLLENHLYETHCIEKFVDVEGQIVRGAPDLVLLDLNLPGNRGLRICEKLRSISQVPIIFVTASQSSTDELNGMLKGGDDYITKPYQPALLLARIAAVLKRSAKQSRESDTRLPYGGMVLDVAAAVLEMGEKKIELSKNELRILRYLFLHPDRYVAREELMDDLWDQAVFIDDNTLSVNMTRIRGKLKPLGLGDMIETKRGIGYKLCKTGMEPSKESL